MSFLIVPYIGILAVFLGKYIFDKWFNPLSIYSFIWMSMILLYELRLIPFADLRIETWVVILLGFISFLLGILTIYFARGIFKKNNTSSSTIPKILLDDGLTIKYAVVFLSIIGFYSAIQHWAVLIDEFGSIVGVLLNATKYYRMRVAGEIKGVVPYIFIASYIGIFLSGIYTAYKKKLTFVAILPILAVILKEIANLGRAGILLGLVEFMTVFILFRYLLSRIHKGDIIKKSRILFAVLIILSLMVGGAILVKSVRNPIDSFQGTSRGLQSFEGNVILSPSIYLYTCSHLGVLNKYLEKDNEVGHWGEHTFLPIYNLISKFGVLEHPSFFQKGYFIPMWTNTGTYLRELDADFGKAGVLIFPYLLGFIITFLWFKFFESGSLMSLILLTYSFLIVIFSFLVMVSRLSSWFISLGVLLIVIPILEQIAVSRSTKKILLESNTTKYKSDA